MPASAEVGYVSSVNTMTVPEASGKRKRGLSAADMEQVRRSLDIHAVRPAQVATSAVICDRLRVLSSSSSGVGQLQQNSVGNRITLSRVTLR